VSSPSAAAALEGAFAAEPWSWVGAACPPGHGPCWFGWAANPLASRLRAGSDGGLGL